MEIKVVANVLKLNDEVAALNRRALAEAGVACLNIMGSPGCGKTALLEATLPRLRPALKIGVIAGDIATTRDAERLAHLCDGVTQINTGGSCHLDANQVRQGLANLDLHALDLVIIENVGNLICPVTFDLGQGAKMGLFSVPEGADKPAKHPRIVLEADLLVLTKTDLLPHVPFDKTIFDADLRSLRDDVTLIETSVVSGAGLDAWCQWVRRFVDERKGVQARQVSQSRTE
ncbi:MAG: hydrogenase nickel incorporation protein HypB [Phycisphaerales bacterium]|nr:hydrogenase nickel incorporation protein HypB [Phycisphaerales bacterium]